MEALPLDRGQVVLDVGCGTGLCCGLLRDKVGPRGGVVGIEESPQMAAVACERIALEGWRNVTVVQSPPRMPGSPRPPTPPCSARCTTSCSPPARCAMSWPGSARGHGWPPGGGKWAAPALMGMNLLISMLHAPYVGSFSGFSRPWRHLEQLVEDVQVREMGFGSGYIMTGRVPGPARLGPGAGRFAGPLVAGGLIHAPGRLPARHRGHRGRHRDLPRPVSKLSTAGPAAAYRPLVTGTDLARHRGKYAHLNLRSTEPRCLSGGKPVTGQAGGCHGLIHPSAG